MLGLVLALFGTSWAHAEDIVARTARLEAEDDVYSLSADFDVNLTPVLEDALDRGVTLYFVMHLEVWRERRWWLDEQIVNSKLTRKLSYNALTRQYRLVSGGLYQNSFSRSEVLRLLGTVRGAPTVPRAALSRDGTYQGQVRMELDISQLPGLFQVDAFASPEWHLKTVAYSWNVVR